MLAQLFTEETLVIIITLVGTAMCTMGIGQVAARGEWLHPMAIIAYILGALVLVIAGAAVFNLELPFIDSARAALFAIVLLAVIKLALTQLHRAFA